MDCFASTSLFRRFGAIDHLFDNCFQGGEDTQSLQGAGFEIRHSRLVQILLQLLQRHGIGQISFATGPSLMGWLRQAGGSYQPVLMVCIVLFIAAAVVVWSGPEGRREG